MNSERQTGERKPTVLRTLDILSKVPSDNWSELSQFQETFGADKYSVNGFETVLSLSGKQFKIRLEQRLHIRPELIRGTDFVITPSDEVKYRIRVVRNEKDKLIYADFHFGTTEDSESAGILYTRLFDEITKPGIDRKLSPQQQLEHDFISAIENSTT